MSDVNVTCIVKDPNNYDSHYGITHLGGRGWVWTKQQVIDSIVSRTNTFYTVANGYRADLQVVNGHHGPYLRSHRDGVPNDNLLALDRCPV